MPDQQEIFEQMAAHTRALYQKTDIPPCTEAGEPFTVMLPMDDGARLRTVCRRPKNVEIAPTVFQRSCYPGMEPILEIHAQEYCRRGFNFVVQWCRGTGGSEGEWEPNVHERADGLAALRWLCGREWVENVGFWGNSYLALTGWCMADAVPEKVKTMVLGVYGTDRHTSAYQDGLFRQDILTGWAMANAGFPIEADYLESCRYRPQAEVDKALWGRELPWYRDWVCSPDRSSPYWAQGFWKMLADIPARVKIPLYIWEGWYDHHLGSAVATWKNLSQEAKAHSVFQAGPWNHGQQPCIQQEHPHLEDFSVSAPLCWFYQILMKKELPRGKALTYVIGKDCWEEWEEFPVLRNGERTFLLDAGKTQGKAYGLSEQCAQAAAACYDYDPENPVLSHGAESLFTTQQGVGSLPQPEAGWRADVLSFVSEPLEEPFEIGGAIEARLFVQSDAEDSAFAVKVMEVFPDGRAVNIRGGITTLAYRGGADTRGTYTPNETAELVIPMWDISWQLQKGSRLRVDVTSSDFPQYAVHPNKKGIWALQESTQIAHQTILTGKETPSRLIFPVVHPKRAPGK